MPISKYGISENIVSGAGLVINTTARTFGKGGIVLSVTATCEPLVFESNGRPTNGGLSMSLTNGGSDVLGGRVSPAFYVPAINVGETFRWTNPMLQEIIAADPVLSKASFDAITTVIPGSFSPDLYIVMRPMDYAPTVLHRARIDVDFFHFAANPI